MDKTADSAAAAVADIREGATIAVGGFGLVGVPATLINNCGVDDWGLGVLLAEGRIRRIIASYIGENKEFARQYLGGQVEVELTPQGTLAERLRAGGVGIPAFFTPTGMGTVVSEGGMPWRYAPDGGILIASPAKQTQVIDSLGSPREYVLETAIRADFGLVRAEKGDRHGNLVFEKSARNFNPVAAMSGRVTIAEVDKLVEPGEIDPDDVHLPGIYVDRVVLLTAEQANELPIEKTTVRTREDGR
jgi:3-oxoacid CoA-transferase subunit A